MFLPPAVGQTGSLTPRETSSGLRAPQGAASAECDHWHDGAGIMTHHVGFTLELEQALQRVDARVALETRASHSAWPSLDAQRGSGQV